jgi:outer membrane protein OmpA-like peptidoglycan-associated protein
VTGTPSWLLSASAAAMVAVVVVAGALVTARQTQADLRARGCAALAAAGVDGGGVTWSGRDATVDADDDLGRLTTSVAVLSRLRGTRQVTVAAGPTAVVSPCPAAGSVTAPAGTGPQAGGTATDASARVVSVKFATNSADLDRAARAQLDALAGWLRRHPEAELRVRGHADNTGFDTRNLPLSYVRAQSVADYLRGRGDGVVILDVRGFSSLEPLVPNISPENRAINRRADVVVEGTG